mmetsp:Transcript_110607/g.174268  ORF Transcript_110607/g.174268 Transcript_110607/m.174268 type:complete len:109 (+) Transcript_110607:57-383(+)
MASTKKDTANESGVWDELTAVGSTRTDMYGTTDLTMTIGSVLDTGRHIELDGFIRAQTENRAKVEEVSTFRGGLIDAMSFASSMLFEVVLGWKSCNQRTTEKGTCLGF